MKAEIKYEAAMERLEEIAEQIERNQLDIDELTKVLKEAQQLIKKCKDKLTRTDEEIQKMLS